MRIIAFAYTTPALVAGAKSVTRRFWREAHAQHFHKGDLVQAYDRSPRAGGKPVAVIRLTEEPRLEWNQDAPDSDWEAEGYQYLYEHPEHIEVPFTRETVSREGFDEWRESGRQSWVVRFELVEVVAPPPQTTAAISGG